MSDSMFPGGLGALLPTHRTDPPHSVASNPDFDPVPQSPELAEAIKLAVGRGRVELRRKALRGLSEGRDEAELAQELLDALEAREVNGGAKEATPEPEALDASDDEILAIEIREPVLRRQSIGTLFKLADIHDVRLPRAEESTKNEIIKALLNELVR